MTSNDQAVASLAGVWAAILAVALTYYLIRSWKRAVITFPARVSSDFSRAENPGMFWFAMFIYFVADAFVIACLLYRIYMYLRPAS